MWNSELRCLLIHLRNYCRQPNSINPTYESVPPIEEG